MIPNIFGKNEDYIMILPLWFWAYYVYYANFSISNIIFAFTGVFSLISRIWISQVEHKVKSGKIKTTSDLTNFVLTRPLIKKLTLPVGPLYMYFTAIYGFFLKKDTVAYLAWVSVVVGVVYLLLYFFFDKEYRSKIIEIANLIKNSLLKRL